MKKKGYIINGLIISFILAFIIQFNINTIIKTRTTKVDWLILLFELLFAFVIFYIYLFMNAKKGKLIYINDQNQECFPVKRYFLISSISSLVISIGMWVPRYFKYISIDEKFPFTLILMFILIALTWIVFFLLMYLPFYTSYHIAKDNKKTLHKIYISILLVLVILVFIGNIFYFWTDSKLSKRQVRSHFETYNLEHSLNLPQDFKLLYTHTSSAIDGYETLIVVSPKSDYKLEYKNQCDSQIHEEFDILEHFYKVSDNTEELNTYACQLSDNYDWYAYEERKETRTYNLFVVYDKDNNYLFVYFISTQYTDLF
ncbi:MAG: hypothetical protein J6Y42_05105 [Bacilli bacterium]|nr:hypothetical protein [Bacilli bacterium]